MDTNSSLPPSSRKIKQTSTEWLIGGGETGELIRSMDWSATPLGPRSEWPQYLRTSASLILNSSFPMVTLWGSELIAIYNDAYKLVIADRHPKAMGSRTREVWPEVWDINEPVFNRVMTGGETIYWEDILFLIARNNCMENAYFTVAYSPIRIEDNQIGGALGVLLETTPRVLLEHKLKQANETLEAQLEEKQRTEGALREKDHLLSESQRIAQIGSWSLDNGAECIRWTDETYRIYGVNPGAFAPTIPNLVSLIHPADRPLMEEWIRGCWAGNQPEELEFRVLHPEGILRTLHGRGDRECAVDGSPIRIVGTVQDFTKRKQAEETLKESQALTRAIVDSTTDMIWSVDSENFDLLTFNRGLSDYYLHRRGIRLYPGMHQDDLFTDQNYINLWRSLYQRTLSEGSYTTEYMVSENSTILHLTFNLLERQGKVFGISVFGKDITERKQAEELKTKLEAQLQQAQKMESVGQLAGGIAHDFNNILGAMMMRLQLLKDDLSLAPEHAELVEDFEEDIRRAADLTRQLLLFGRRQVMQVKTLDLNDLVENLLKMLRRLIGEQLKLVLEMNTAPLSIEADPGMIEQVILNLCVNARDAMPKGGDLLIKTQALDIDEHWTQINPEARSGRFACLTVLDQGCGIDADTLQHIFEPFFTTKEVGRGTGLGLSTVHGIVKQHGGWVEVESILNQSTMFRVYLPASTNTPKLVTGRSKGPLLRGKETILLVEDEDNYRRMLAILMRRQGYEVIEAANGVEAMRQWESHQDRIDLLLTDMVMPEGMTGLELGEKIRSLKPDTAVVISSGYSIDLLERANPNLSGFLYLSKPCDADRLMKTIRKALDEI